MNQGNIDTLNDLFKEYRVEFQMIALIPVKLDWRLFMKNLFEHTSSPWIRYSSYEYRTAEDGTLYIVVSKDAKPEMYNPMKDAESLVLDAVNIGLQVMHKAPEDELKSMVLSFINSYGFLGFWQNEFSQKRGRIKLVGIRQGRHCRLFLYNFLNFRYALFCYICNLL